SFDNTQSFESMQETPEEPSLEDLLNDGASTDSYIEQSIATISSSNLPVMKQMVAENNLIIPSPSGSINEMHDAPILEYERVQNQSSELVTENLDRSSSNVASSDSAILEYEHVQNQSSELVTENLDGSGSSVASSDS